MWTQIKVRFKRKLSLKITQFQAAPDFNRLCPTPQASILTIRLERKSLSLEFQLSFYRTQGNLAVIKLCFLKKFHLVKNIPSTIIPIVTMEIARRLTGYLTLSQDNVLKTALIALF